MRSLYHKLFLRYAALIFPVIVIFMLILYSILGNSLHTNASSELQADCDNISTLLDTEFQQADSLSQYIVSSGQIKSLFLEDLYSYGITAYNNRYDFTTALFDIIKLRFNNMTLRMMDTEGRYIYVGETTSFQMRSAEEMMNASWFRQVLDAHGKKIILPPRILEHPTDSSLVLSLSRAFSPDNSVDEDAILEINIDYAWLSQMIQEAIHNQKDAKQIYIYNENGNLIFPFDAPPAEEFQKYMLESLVNDSDTGAPLTCHSAAEDTLLFARNTSAYTHWTIFVSASERIIFSAYYEFRAFIIVVSFIVLLFLLFITYRIAFRVAAPLQKLEQTVRTLTFENLASSPLPDYQSGIKELDSLFHSFEQMQINLQNSLQETVAAHTAAADAKLIALQSQMNPHFLYNTLASISILAEDNVNEKVIQMCTDLSALLRYCSSNTSMNVPLSQELDILFAYIHLIKVKYEERIRFHIQIDDQLMSLKVPKLLLQPLAENCVKYALDVDPPWNISIIGYVRGDNWFIEVTDNGSGFSFDYLEHFRRQVHGLTPETPLPDLAINGMGLLNLYMRLLLRYKRQLIFELNNIPNGGARVVIGASYVESTGDED